MRHKIESKPEFVLKIRNDPVELIKATKEHAMAHQDTKHPELTVLEAMEAFVRIRQKDDESLADHLDPWLPRALSSLLPQEPSHRVARRERSR